MELRICSCDADIRALAALATEIWHEYFTAIISKEQIDYMVEKFQSYPVLKKAIEEENYTYFLAYEEGAMIGFCGVKPEKDRLFLSKLYLHKKARGKGLSSILLKRAISFAREQDKKAIYLTCNKFNQHSLMYTVRRASRISTLCRRISDKALLWMTTSSSWSLTTENRKPRSLQ